jgi:Type II secretory pathway, component PulF
MATFAYVGRTRSGAVKKGELSAKTRDEAVDQLRKQSVVVTSLEEKKGGAGGFKLSFGSGLTDKDLVVFTRQFGTMINAGCLWCSVSKFSRLSLRIKCCERRSEK